MIPVLNGESTIERAIHSALAQGPGVEILVTDDGSTDRTGDLLGAFAGDQVKVFKHPRPRGIGAARNTAAEAARSEFLIFLDGDDELLPGIARRQVAAFEAAGTDVGVIGGRVAVIEQEGQPPARRWPLDDAPAQPTLESLLAANCIPLTGSTLRLEVFRRIGGFNEELRIMGAADYNLWLRAAQVSEIRLVPYDVGRLYRDRSTASSDLPRMLEARYLAILDLDRAVVDLPVARRSLALTAEELASSLPPPKSWIWRMRAARHRLLLGSG